MSIGAEPSITPLKPPIKNVEIKPIANSKGLSKRNLPPQSVATQLNTLMPVGTATSKVATMKNMRNQSGVPLVNIWCAHTNKPNAQIIMLE